MESSDLRLSGVPRPHVHPKVMLCQPRCMEDMPGIADQMRGMFAILLNMEYAPQDLTHRMLDIVSGIAYGMDYQMSQVSSHSYLILPQNVELIGEGFSADF